jgi:acetyl-CoA carboxylase biotin carboxylase subunit
MLYDGYVVPPFYDSLLGKLIVHGADRSAALMRMRQALQELDIGGLKTTKPLHAALVDDPDVINGRYHTKFLEGWLTRHALAAKQNDEAHAS